MKYLTLDWLEKHKASEEEINRFEKRFGTKATIKEVVDVLHEINKPHWEAFLLAQSLPLTIAMIEAGADIHANNDVALCLAAELDHLGLVEYLVENGIDIHANHDFALRSVAARGHLKLAKYLVEHGADIHANDDLALFFAKYNKHTRTAEFLEKVAKAA